MRGNIETMNTEWVPGAGVGIVGSIIAWVLSWRISTARGEERVSAMQQDIRELKGDFRDGMTEVRSFAATVGAMQSSQNVTNKITSDAIEGMTETLDRHSTQIADHAATLRLITEVVMAKNGTR